MPAVGGPWRTVFHSSGENAAFVVIPSSFPAGRLAGGCGYSPAGQQSITGTGRRHHPRRMNQSPGPGEALIGDAGQAGGIAAAGSPVSPVPGDAVINSQPNACSAPATST